jgi:hypothetical protein
VQLLATAVSTQHVLDVLLAPFLTLSTFATFWSGLFATTALMTGESQKEMSRRVDVGLAVGFVHGLPIAAVAFGVGLSST